MKTKAVRLHGKKQLSLDVIELPKVGKRELRAKIVTNSLCLSTHKAWKQGEAHKRTPDDLKKNPVIVGHEFAGIIEEVGEDLKNRYSEGDFFILQPSLFYTGPLFVHGGIYAAPGYSFPFCGGNAQDIIIPQPVIDSNTVLTFKSCAFFKASLAEPLSCIIGAAHEQYHCKMGKHHHIMGIKEDGNLAILGGGGPMGLAMVDYFLHADRSPSLIMVTEIDENRLTRAKKLFHSCEGEPRVVFLNPRREDLFSKAKELTGGKLFDDIFTLFPSKELIETSDKLLGENGTSNFFAGPSDKDLSASINFYHLHYSYHKHIGTSGGNTDDLKEALKLLEEDRLNPAQMITAVGGLDSVISAIENFLSLPPGKKLIYTGIKMPLVELSQLKHLSEEESTPPVYKKVYRDLHAIIIKNGELWCEEAEQYILKRKEISL
ncbi:MAG TPA: L-sorbose 1-phosphate reductase [Candidatus Omnitrophica bacterium]|nr:L-sorbose 1-phosphate reductase [Candidatus Omnitrophota bacterium]